MTRVEQEDTVVEQLGFGQPFAILLALDEPCQYVALRVERMAAA